MARQSFQDRLQTLRGEVAAMADTVLDRYRDAVEAFRSGDRREAQTVVDGDEMINQWYLDIETDCVQLLALQHPVAGDLRFVVSTFKIATDLERIGDLAVNMAEYGQEASGDPAAVEIEPVAGLAGQMVEDAIEAYTTDDAEQAREVTEQDDELDRRCRELSETLAIELLRNDPVDGNLEQHLAEVSRTLLTIRDIERVGDHAVNICARTVYATEHDDELLY